MSRNPVMRMMQLRADILYPSALELRHPHESKTSGLFDNFQINMDINLAP